MADQIKVATLREEGVLPTTLNTFDDLPVMIVFTFSSTTDFAESLLTMSLKSTYYPKPISGSRLFVEPALVTRYDPSGAVLFLSKRHTKIYDITKRHCGNFYKMTFYRDNRDRINRMDVTIGWQTS